MSELAAKIMVLKAALIDGAPHRATGWEWCKALDEILSEVRAEAGVPSVSGDVSFWIDRALVSWGVTDHTDADIVELIDYLSREGVVVLGKGDYDELVKRGRGHLSKGTTNV